MRDSPFKRGTKTMSRCSRKSRVSGNLDDDDNDLLIRPGWPGTSIRSQRGKKSLSPSPSSVFLSLLEGQSCLCARSLARFLPFCRGDTAH